MDRIDGDDLAFQVEPLQEPQRAGSFEAFAARGRMPDNRQQTAAERRKHLFGPAYAVFACPHRLAVDGDMTRVFVLLEIQSAKDTDQRARR